MIWSKLRRQGISPLALPGPYSELFVLDIPLDNTRWLIGSYQNLTTLATHLRQSPDLWDALADERVRIGLRDTDRAPVGLPREKRYGQAVRGERHATNFIPDRHVSKATPFSDVTQTNRISDQLENVKNFWHTQTPQSHHIVEFNHMEELGASNKSGIREIDHRQLPAVLLAAEFHQRYFSAILKRTHHLNAGQLKEGIATTYRELYVGRSTLFHPLWDISKVILHEAGILVS